jgi:hypothetical protein
MRNWKFASVYGGTQIFWYKRKTDGRSQQPSRCDAVRFLCRKTEFSDILLFVCKG